MNILIAGSGAVGGYFGARLAQAGINVTFLARGEHFKKIKASGLNIKSINGDVLLHPANFCEQLDHSGSFDVIFVAVKSFQLDDLIGQIKPVVTPHTMIVPLLNGVEAVDKLAANFSPEQVIGGLAKIISRVSAPGEINHSGADPHLTLGELNGVKSPRLYALSELLTQASISHGITGNIRVALWRKYLFVAGWSVVAALARAPIGRLREQAATRALLKQSLDEFLAIAQSQGVTLTEKVIDDTLGFLDVLPAHSETSLQRDIAKGYAGELNSLLGYANQLAVNNNVNTPLLSTAFACLQAQVNQH